MSQIRNKLDRVLDSEEMHTWLLLLIYIAPGVAQTIHLCFACGQSLQAPVGGLTSSSSTGSLVQNHLLKDRYRILE